MGGVSRKTVYAAVAAGMRVARLSDDGPRRDSRGHLWQGRILFNTAWIDEFLERRATCHRLEEAKADAPNSLNSQRRATSAERTIATRLQRPAENAADIEPAGGR